MYSSEIYVIYFGQKQLSSKKRNTQENLGITLYFEKIPLFSLNADINFLNLRTSAITDMVFFSTH